MHYMHDTYHQQAGKNIQSRVMNQCSVSFTFLIDDKICKYSLDEG